MRTSIDCNVLSAIWSNEPSAPQLASQLTNAKRQGALLLSPFAYAETLAHPRVSQQAIDDFISHIGIRIDYHPSEPLWGLAGNRYGEYSARRRLAGAGTPRRILADFLIGAHALLHAERLMTLDHDFYARNFPEVSLYRPASNTPS